MHGLADCSSIGKLISACPTARDQQQKRALRCYSRQLAFVLWTCPGILFAILQGLSSFRRLLRSLPRHHGPRLALVACVSREVQSVFSLLGTWTDRILCEPRRAENSKERAQVVGCRARCRPLRWATVPGPLGSITAIERVRQKEYLENPSCVQFDSLLTVLAACSIPEGFSHHRARCPFLVADRVSLLQQARSLLQQIRRLSCAESKSLCSVSLCSSTPLQKATLDSSCITTLARNFSNISMPNINLTNCFTITEFSVWIGSHYLLFDML